MAIDRFGSETMRSVLWLMGLVITPYVIAILLFIVGSLLLPHPDSILDPRIVYPDDYNLAVMIDQFDGDGQRTVTLHKYASPQGRYLTTGESITFQFPTDAFFWRMQRGIGAQSEIYLYLDLQDLEPIVPRLRKTGNLGNTEEEWREHHELQRRATLAIVNDPMHARTFLKDVDDGALVPTEEHCGLRKYIDARTEERGKVLAELAAKRYPVREPYDLRKDTFVSEERITDDYGRDSFMFFAECTIDTPSHCVVHAYFENWPIYFSLSQDRMCAWRDELARFQRYFAAHVTARTPPVHTFQNISD